MSDSQSINQAVSASNIDNPVNDILSQAQIQPQHQPGGFRRFLGAAVGIAGCVFAPGLGGVLGNILGGGLGLGSSSTNPAQFLQLQQQIDAQTEAFQTVSAVLKSKHDTAMAAIENMK
jgi:hypothetical protein